MTIYEKYLEYRRQGYPARRAARLATGKDTLSPKPATIDWHRDKAEVKRGRFTVRLEMRVDENPDLSYLGEYTDRWQDGAIDRTLRGDCRRHEYRYWIPANPSSDDFTYYRSQGMNRHEAQEKAKARVLADYRRHEAYNHDVWEMMGIVATALVIGEENGVEIPCGNASFWGIESDAGEFIDEAAEVLITEAIADAETNIPNIIRNKQAEIMALA